MMVQGRELVGLTSSSSDEESSSTRTEENIGFGNKNS